MKSRTLIAYVLTVSVAAVLVRPLAASETTQLSSVASIASEAEKTVKSGMVARGMTSPSRSHW